MSIINQPDNNYFIPISSFEVCIIDKISKEQIKKLFRFKNKGAYYLHKFIDYIKEYHNLSIQDYIEKFLLKKWPLCPVSLERVGYRVNGKGIFFSTFKKGKINKENCPAFKKACEKFSRERLGENNPMFGKKSWNSGLTKYSDARIENISQKRNGIKFTDQHKNKLRNARRNHPLKARHISKHSEFSKEKMRQATIKRWQNGDFSFKKTSIETKVENWLIENDINYLYQHGVGGFVADFACVSEKILIECHGDFFHCNPRIQKYSVPRYDIQKRNLYRDSIKRKIYAESSWKLIELWESDINSGKFKDVLKCELKK